MRLIGTHSGSMHLDESIGVSILKTLFPLAKVIRSREPLVWAVCDALVDVGGEYDPSRNRFDHHQRGFAEKRADGSGPYAGAGLVWRTYGEAYVRQACPGLSPELIEKVASEVDHRLIRHADAVDVGISVPGPHAFSLSGIVDGFNASWQDEPGDDDARFALASQVASMALRNLVRAVASKHTAAKFIRRAPRLSNGRILVVDIARAPFVSVICAEMPEVLFVVYPVSAGQQYQVRVVPKESGSFTARADLPLSWAGLTGADLAEASGVADAVFCHNGRFICGARSREGALKMAEAAVREVEAAQA